MKSAKTTFLKGLRALTMVGLFGLILGSFLVPITKAKADVLPVAVAIEISPGTIDNGQSALLSWASSNATNISISPGIGSVSPYGSQNVSPTQTTTYTITGTNTTGGYGTASATVIVRSQPPTCQNPAATNYGGPLPCTFPPAPTCQDPGALNYHGPLPCQYPQPPQVCQNPAATNYGGPLPCTFPPAPTCQNPAATNYGGPLPCTFSAPTVTLYANPSSITSGQNSTLTWNSTNASSCSAYWTGSNATSGSGIVVPTYTTTYTITCYGTNSQQVSANATVNVNNNQTCRDTSATNYGGALPCTYYQQIQVCQDPSALNYRGVLPCSYNNIYPYVNQQPTVVVYADQASVPYNGTATIRWITTNATSCNASGGSLGWAGIKSIGPGSFYTGSLTGSRTYSITCSNSFGSAFDSVTVAVRGLTVNTVAPRPTSLVLITSSVDRNQPIVPTLDNTRPRPGDEINYTVNYQNIGTGSITGLSLRMDLPYEVDYMFSTPNNPTRSGNTLIFNLGTLKANGQGTVTVRVRVRDNIPAGTNLNFPATLSYIDPSGQPQSVSANVSAQVWSQPVNETITPAVVVPLGANVFGAGFLPINLFGWLLLLILILILVLLAKYLLSGTQSFSKRTTTTLDQPLGKKTTTTTIQ